jgi:hypothetical protein
MLGFKVNYFDDPRLCAISCSVPALAVQMTSSPAFGSNTSPPDARRRLGRKDETRSWPAHSYQSVDVDECYSKHEVFETRLPGISGFLGDDLGSTEDATNEKEKKAPRRPRLPFSRSVDDNVVFNSMHALADAYRV